MTETTKKGATPARTERPRTRIGRPFALGNGGRPKGLRDKRTRVGIEICDAMSGQAAETLRALLSSRSGRIRLEAAKAILLWSWGAPKQSVTVAGGFGDLARELTAALQEARVRRAALESFSNSEALSASPSALPALDAGPVLPGLEAAKPEGEK
jgi:hypothetical protein